MPIQIGLGTCRATSTKELTLSCAGRESESTNLLVSSISHGTLGGQTSNAFRPRTDSDLLSSLASMPTHFNFRIVRAYMRLVDKANRQTFNAKRATYPECLLITTSHTTQRHTSQHTEDAQAIRCGLRPLPKRIDQWHTRRPACGHHGGQTGGDKTDSARR